MKIWVLAADYDVEGVGDPEVAYTSKEAAEAAARKVNPPKLIFEIELEAQ
jgi:hypothetical protein